MGIKGLYGYCIRNIRECYRQVHMIDEIKKFNSEKGRKPLIIINLSTLTYHLANVKDLLCGYQLNNIKLDFENFMTQLQEAGCDLQFVFKKQNVSDLDWQQRRLNDYLLAVEMIDEIEKVKELDKLESTFLILDKLPFNSLILSSILQSATKFGKVHGYNENDGNSLSCYTNLIKKEKADYMMGLNSYLFLTLDIKIWNDIVLNVNELTVMEINPIIIKKHLNVTAGVAPLYAVLSGIGYLKSSPKVCQRVRSHFGTKNQFQLIANFIRNLKNSSSSDNMIENIVEKIFGKTPHNAKIIQDFHNSLNEFKTFSPIKIFPNISFQRLKRMQNDFTNFGEDILCNNTLFINPIFCDLKRNDIKSINELVLPLLEKTAGKLLSETKNYDDRHVIILENCQERFMKLTLKANDPGPDFDFLTFAVDFPPQVLNEFELIPKEYHLDIYVLFYLLRNESIHIIEAEIAMKTLVDIRRKTIAGDKEYPVFISQRAFLLTFLYSKVYFYFVSCLTALDHKNIYAEFKFDGFYFQKLYQLNLIDEMTDEMTDPYNDSRCIEVFKDLVTIINEGLKLS